MNLTAIFIVGIICWAIVELKNGPKGKKKDTMQQAQYQQDMEEVVQELRTLQDRVETLEKIVTDEKYQLKKEIDSL